MPDRSTRSTLRVPSASARTSYHGFPIVVRERDLTILDPSGRRLFEGRMELSSARRFIRAYKRGSLSEPGVVSAAASRSLNDPHTKQRPSRSTSQSRSETGANKEGR